jgi:transposase-like protein
MAQHAPGRSDRNGLTIVELLRMFPDDDTAERWFEQQRWPDGLACPNCGCMRIVRTTHPTMPLRCKDCRKFFSVKKGTVMESSKLGFQTWAIVTYMATTNLKGVSSMKIHRELGITQKAAWHLIQRVREAFSGNAPLLGGTVEIDETYVGGKERNRHASKRTYGRGTQGKTAVMGAKERDGKVVARPIGVEPGETFAGFVLQTVKVGETVYTDEHRGYQRLERCYTHEAVKHSAGEYVREQVHTNGIESFWAMMKRGIVGVYHHVSKKHLHRYVNEFTGRHNIRGLDTLEQMSAIARMMSNKRLRYADLIA